MPTFDVSAPFSKGDVLDVQEITGDHLDTTVQSIGSATVRDDGTVDITSQRVGRFLLIGKKKTVGVIIRSDGRNQGPINVARTTGKWQGDQEATFERLDAPLNTEQSEAQTYDHPAADDDLGPGADVEETPPFPEEQAVSEKELQAAIEEKAKPSASTEGLTAPQAAVEQHAFDAEAKAARQARKNAARQPRKK